MRGGGAWLVVGALLASHAAQIPPTPPREPDSLRSIYGPAHPVELDQLAANPESYQKRNVVTRGFLEPLDLRGYWSLSLVTARVLLVPGEGLVGSDMQLLQGRRVEVTGVVRLLKSCASEPPCRIGHCSICEDPELPQLPDPRVDWPRASITIFSLSDISASGERARESERSSLADLMAGDSLAGRDVRIVGQFRGRNLFDDLPASSQRTTSDWVLKEGERAVWVTGKKPQGKGWRLDAELKSDARWWLEVVGSVEVVGGVVYVRAKRVSLTTAPPAPSKRRH